MIINSFLVARTGLATQGPHQLVQVWNRFYSVQIDNVCLNCLNIAVAKKSLHFVSKIFVKIFLYHYCQKMELLLHQVTLKLEPLLLFFNFFHDQKAACLSGQYLTLFDKEFRIRTEQCYFENLFFRTLSLNRCSKY